MKAKVKMVDKLESEGKTYNLYVKGHLLMNLTLESGHELNAEIALDIVKDIAKATSLYGRARFCLMLREPAPAHFSSLKPNNQGARALSCL